MDDGDYNTGNKYHYYNISDILQFINARSSSSSSATSIITINLDESYNECSVQEWLKTQFLLKTSVHKNKLLLPGSQTKTTNHFGSIYIPYILQHLQMRYRVPIKYYVIFRNPMARIISSYIFMVGEEKHLIPDQFENVNRFIQRDLRLLSQTPNNMNSTTATFTVLERMIHSLKQGLIENEKHDNESDTAASWIWRMNWESILSDWIAYESETRLACHQYARILRRSASHKNPAFTCERDLFRASVGDSCYILPLMFWMRVFGRTTMLDSFRIIQTEALLMDGYNNMQLYIDRLMCFWDDQKCASETAESQSQSQSSHYAKTASTSQYQNNAHKYPDFVPDDNTLRVFLRVFQPCNDLLNVLLTQEMPQLMLAHSFDLQLWQNDA
jgi:hypothetical protein